MKFPAALGWVWGAQWSYGDVVCEFCRLFSVITDPLAPFPNSLEAGPFDRYRQSRLPGHPTSVWAVFCPGKGYFSSKISCKGFLCRTKSTWLCNISIGGISVSSYLCVGGRYGIVARMLLLICCPWAAPLATVMWVLNFGVYTYIKIKKQPPPTLGTNSGGPRHLHQLRG